MSSQDQVLHVFTSHIFDKWECFTLGKRFISFYVFKFHFWMTYIIIMNGVKYGPNYHLDPHVRIKTSSKQRIKGRSHLTTTTYFNPWFVIINEWVAWSSMVVFTLDDKKNVWPHKICMSPSRRRQVQMDHKGSFTLCVFFSDCDCDSSYHNKKVAQDSMEVFALCDCNNIINSYSALYEQKQIAVTNRTVWTGPKNS